MRRGLANDEGSLVDFLGTSETGLAGQDRGVTGSGSTADGADRFGLFTASGGASTSSGSRVGQSRARYDTLFGEEVR